MKLTGPEFRERYLRECFSVERRALGQKLSMPAPGNVTGARADDASGAAPALRESRGRRLKTRFTTRARRLERTVLDVAEECIENGMGSVYQRWRRINPVCAISLEKCSAADAWSVQVDTAAKRILIIDERIPEPERDSGSLRLVSILKLLQSLDGDIVLYSESAPCSVSAYQNLVASGVSVVWPDQLSEGRSGLTVLLRQADMIMLCRAGLANRYIDLTQKYPGKTVIFDTVDLHYLRMQRMAELKSRWLSRYSARRMKTMELDIVRKADITLVVSAVEKELLQFEVPETDVRVVSNIHVEQESSPGYSGRKDIVFIGSFSHRPNVDAACYLIDNIYPLIRDKNPEIGLLIVGSGAPDSLLSRAGEGVRFTGWVADLSGVLNGCRLSVAPLRYGAGVKGKILTSMSHGLPVVATSMAVEGMGIEDGVQACVRDGDRRFAAAVVDLYEDEPVWNRISGEGRRLVREVYSEQVARDVLEGIVRGKSPNE